MTADALRELLFWCLIVNVGLYAISAIAIGLMRGFLCRLHQKLYGLDEKTVSAFLFGYIAVYKLLITVFLFTPWIGLVIVGS